MPIILLVSSAAMLDLLVVPDTLFRTYCVKVISDDSSSLALRLDRKNDQLHKNNVITTEVWKKQQQQQPTNQKQAKK